MLDDETRSFCVYSIGKRRGKSLVRLNKLDTKHYTQGMYTSTIIITLSISCVPLQQYRACINNSLVLGIPCILHHCTMCTSHPDVVFFSFYTIPIFHILHLYTRNGYMSVICLSCKAFLCFSHSSSSLHLSTCTSTDFLSLTYIIILYNESQKKRSKKCTKNIGWQCQKPLKQGVGMVVCRQGRDDGIKCFVTYIFCMSPSSLGNCTLYSTWCIMICLVIPSLSLLLFIQSLYSFLNCKFFHLLVSRPFFLLLLVIITLDIEH